MVFSAKRHTFGKLKEAEILPQLIEHFKTEIQAYESLVSKHDFFDEEYNYELKSRTCKRTSYSTTLLAVNKVVENDKKLRFIFNYTDSLAYIEYDKTKFESYNKSYTSADEKLHYFIPIEDLEIIKFW